MMVLKRLAANFIDIFVFIAIVVGVFLLVPRLFPLAEGEELNLLIAGGILVFILGLTFLLQLPFLLAHQTIGKAFFRLKIVTKNPSRPLTLGIIIQRELFTKVFPCYLLCLPTLFGKEGLHDKTCETEVV